MYCFIWGSSPQCSVCVCVWWSALALLCGGRGVRSACVCVWRRGSGLACVCVCVCGPLCICLQCDCSVFNDLAHI
ncbi:hypothetical protein FKM82_019207 [Ascaphus truei]